MARATGSGGLGGAVDALQHLADKWYDNKMAEEDYARKALMSDPETAINTLPQALLQRVVDVPKLRSVVEKNNKIKAQQYQEQMALKQQEANNPIAVANIREAARPGQQEDAAVTKLISDTYVQTGGRTILPRDVAHQIVYGAAPQQAAGLAPAPETVQPQGSLSGFMPGGQMIGPAPQATVPQQPQAAPQHQMNFGQSPQPTLTPLPMPTQQGNVVKFNDGATLHQTVDKWGYPVNAGFTQPAKPDVLTTYQKQELALRKRGQDITASSKTKQQTPEEKAAEKDHEKWAAFQDGLNSLDVFGRATKYQGKSNEEILSDYWNGMNPTNKARLQKHYPMDTPHFAGRGKSKPAPAKHKNAHMAGIDGN